jgi:hypothetical protein
VGEIRAVSGTTADVTDVDRSWLIRRMKVRIKFQVPERDFLTVSSLTRIPGQRFTSN